MMRFTSTAKGTYQSVLASKS